MAEIGFFWLNGKPTPFGLLPAAASTRGKTLTHPAESKALATGKWASLVMCASGILAAYLSNSDALLVDGLYSGVNFFAAVIAARVAGAVARPADRHYPFGYDALEALYVTFRSLVLAGILVFAVFGAGQKILIYLSGGQVRELIYGPILVYSAAMVLICLGLAARYHRAWLAGGRQSALLQAERRAALVDGIMSAGAGAALVSSPLLLGTRFAGLVPIADSLIVLVLALVMLPQPMSMFRAALGEVAGAAARGDADRIARTHARQVFADRKFDLVDVAVTRLGRSYFAVFYINPTEPVLGADIDALRAALAASFSEVGAPVRIETVVTASSPFGGAGPAPQGT